ncbi:MAG: hypothetical protein COT73_05775 [Bdellovibrio sp. CG10_big_fil_rev_8_21_14_0_10_47_8]|nr:MAG: hypothetical protein COT73_05775 [Bdellovibrio sp. CG10_big_fil_rev_8_21_14_0_10_47_8]
MRFVTVPFFIFCFVLPLALQAQEFSEFERLSGFAGHQRRDEKLEASRLAGVDEVKKERQEWEKELERAVADFKAQRARNLAPLQEISQDYLRDIQRKAANDKEMEAARQQYVNERDRKRRELESKIHVTEAEEYGLDHEVDRVDIHKRVLYGSQSPWSKGNISSRPSRPEPSGSTDFGGGDSYEGAPPPPPPPPPPAGTPEFFEPDIPPPPDVFDDSPPPFDDPDF